MLNKQRLENPRLDLEKTNSFIKKAQTPSRVASSGSCRRSINYVISSRPVERLLPARRLMEAGAYLPRSS